MKNDLSKERNDEIMARDYTSEIDLSYQENGKLSTIKYHRSPWIYSTTSSSGEIYYDEKGRVIYEDSYITHGTQYYFYLYKDEEENPWAYIYLDSMSFDYSNENGAEYGYGNYLYAYIFQAN